MRRRHCPGVAFALAALAATAAGCGRPKDADRPTEGLGSGDPTTVISGLVTCNGQPLPTGAVVFLTDDGPVGQGMLGPDARYQAGLVPEGPVKVVYSARAMSEDLVRRIMGGPSELPAFGSEAERPEDLTPGGVTKSGDPAPPGPPPPTAEVLRLAKAAEAKYGTPAKSPLTYTVVRGPQTFDIVLTTDTQTPNSTTPYTGK